MKTPSYVLPASLTPDALLETLAGRFELLEEPGRGIERLYLDTFDWRLYRGGGVLLAKQTDGNLALIWEDRDKGKPLASCLAERLPEWPSDIPAGALREGVAPLVEMRRLLPLARLRSQVRLVRLCNEDRKTVVRLLIELPRCFTPEGRDRGELPPRVLLVPVKGYDKALRTVAEVLEKELQLATATASLFTPAIECLGRQPLDYSSKLTIALEPDMPAEAAMKVILRQLLDTLVANIPGTKQDIDSEFLHDLRVATRRTRSALTQVKGVLPGPLVADFKQRFAWLGQVTGPTRDLDVFLLDFARYQQSLPAELQPDLLPLRDYLLRHQAEEQQALRRRLNSPHFHKLLKDWRAVLDSPLAGLPQAADAGRPIKAVADKRIWRMYKRVIREGRAIHPGSEPAALHELRKSCKKLRYLIEFFQSLYPAGEIRTLLKPLKRLLDNLGQFQDLEVQAHKLRDLGAGVLAEDPGALPTVFAMGALVGDLLHRQEAAREDFQGCFARLDTEGKGHLAALLFKPVKAGKGR